MKKKLFSISLIILLICACIFPHISGVGLTVAAKGKIRLNKTSLSMEAGDKTKLKLKNAGKKTVKWTSSDKAVAKVSKKGKVTAVADGSCTITAKVKERLNFKNVVIEFSCQVTVGGTETGETPGEGGDSENIEVPAGSTASLELAKKMGAGWNLGNTLEAVGDWFDPTIVKNFETAWGNPVTTKSMITKIKSCGFRSVRIPVAWSNMITEDGGNWTIDEAYLKRVSEVVNYAVSQDMYAIVNIHWDSGWWEGFGNAATQTATLMRYEKMWKQIAEYFKDYSHQLIFESANEELGWNSLSADDSYRMINKVNQKFVDVVRATGSKNTDRFLLIAGYNTDIWKTCDSRFIMPTDSAAERLLISVHYYNPPIFCIADDPNNSWGYAASWGTEEEKQQVKTDLELMKKTFMDKGYGVIIGEYGCPDKKEDKYTHLYLTTVAKTAYDMGICAMLWDAGGWFNRRAESFPADLESFYQTLVPKN